MNSLSHLKPAEIDLRQKWCKGCGICVALCPKGVLALDARGKIVVLDINRCNKCRMCEMHCPDFAISIGEVQS
jgi:2-oxoglutarate ferredoxin oxidoreductase subunit delta